MKQQQHMGITPPGNYRHLCTGESLPPFPFTGVPVGGLRHLFCMPVGSSLFHYQHSFSQPGLPGWWVDWLEQYGHLLYIPHSGQLRLGATCCIYIYTYVIRTGLDVIIISLQTRHLLAILPDHSPALQTARDMRWNEPRSALLQSQAQLASVLGGSSVKLCSGPHSTPAQSESFC